MKTLTEKIVDRLEAEAKSWEHKTPQCEALFMAAKIVANEFAEEEKEVMKKCVVMGMEFIPVDPTRYEEDAELIFNETFKTKEKEVIASDNWELLNWFLCHYETSTTEEGLLHYVSADGDIATIAEILEHYNKEK